MNDYTVPAENGEIVGTVTKLTSGAPIGDDSKYLYTTDWSGEKVMLSASAGDKFTAKLILGDPFGVHVYRVIQNPISLLDCKQLLIIISVCFVLRMILLQVLKVCTNIQKIMVLSHLLMKVALN